MAGTKTKKTIKEKQPQRHVTPPTTPMTAPSGHRERILPLVDVGSKAFEYVCLEILRQAFPEVERVSLKRVSGVEQYGVDVEGFDLSGNPTVVISAKCYRHIDAWEFRPWIADFSRHLEGHWKDRGVTHFVLAVTVETNDDGMNDAARSLIAELNTAGIQFHLWDSLRISDMLKTDPSLVDRYFNRYWVDAISAEVQVGSPTVEASAPLSLANLGPSINGIIGQLQGMYLGPLNDALTKSLEAAVSDLRKGRRSTLKDWLRNAQKDAGVWEAIDSATRAKSLRAAAMVALGDEDSATCARLLEEADALVPAPDRSARAYLTRARSGLAAALEALRSPETRREKELCAAFLLEDGNPVHALDVLKPLVGEEVSSEVLRLRAIAGFLAGGDIRKALNDAKSSLAKDTDSAMALQTVAILRVASSLAHGVFLPFSGVPNPVSGSLVRSGVEARSSLARAVVEFDRLLETLEGDFRSEVEVWRLAALLLNSDTRVEARLYGRYLMSKDRPAPAAVAWCMLHGLSVRRGRIRKSFADTLRRREGDPGHVAVLALIESKVTRPQIGIGIIERYAPDFPQAVEFFDHWRIQFGQGSLHPERSYPDAVRHAAVNKDPSALGAYLLSEEASVENILSGAQFLASEGWFAEIVRLGPKLEAIGTPRAVEIAAISALRTDDARSCLAILAGARSGGMEWTPRLVRLNLSAHEALGNHREIIDDLRALLHEREDPQLRDQLLNAYLRIGALEDIKLEAERALDAGSLGGRRAVQLAYALRVHAPDVARKALAGIKGGKLPDEMVGALLTLSSELGMADLQDEMVRRLSGNPEGHGGIVRFDSVEAVLSMLEKQAEEYRGVLRDWELGSVPAALAMRAEIKDYALLLLGEEGIRRNRMGEPLPMLLTAATAGGKVPKIGGPEKLALRLDLSAFLVADRLGILPKLEVAFEIHIPESLPEALIEMGTLFTELSTRVFQAVQMVARGESALEKVSVAPSGATQIDMFRKPPEDFENSAPAAVFAEAYRAGHVSKEEFDVACQQLDLPKPATEDALLPTCVLLTRFSLVELARLNLLEPFASTLPTYVLDGEVEKLVGQIRVVEAEEKLGLRLGALRKSVTEKLKSSEWKTIVNPTEKQRERVRNIPAHVRCLMETLPRDDAPDSLFWIEDRALSKQPLPGALSLCNVMEALRANGLMSVAEHARAVGQLRSWGYLFLPIDVANIAETIARAPIVGGEVVENSDLIQLRKWYARDVLSLRYTDQTIVVDPDGRIVGETRRMLDLASLTRDLLALLWESPDATIEQRIARATWVWVNLRLDYMPSPPAADVPGARRQFTTLTTVQSITLPLTAALERKDMSVELYQAYIHWLMSNIVSPMAEADPDVREDIVTMIAPMLAKLLEDPKDIEPEILAPFQQEMRSIVGNFLQLLPADWANAIGARLDIDAVIGRVTVMLLDLGEGDQVAVTALEAGFAEALVSPKRQAVVALHKTDRVSTLEILETSGEPLKALLSLGKRRQPIDPYTVAMVHPDPSVRTELLLSLGEGENVGNPMKPDFLQGLAEEPSAERRVEILHDVHRRDLSNKLEIVRERVANNATVQVADFTLPDPGVLLNFLGLSDRFSGSAIDLVSASRSLLTEKLGIEGAFYRLSSLPLTLPDDLLSSFGNHVSAHEADWSDQTFGSLCFALARILSTVAAGLPFGDTEKQLLSEVSRSNTRLFVAILRHGSRQAVYAPAWRDLDPELAFCLVWLHADQLARTMDESRIDIDHLAGWIEARTPQRIGDHEQQTIWPNWILRLSLKARPSRLLATFAAKLIEQGVSQAVVLKDVVGYEESIGWFPHPEAVATAPAAPAGYWMAGDPIPAFEKAGWIAKNGSFSDRDPSKLLLRTLDEMASSDPSVMVSLIALIIDIAAVDDPSLEMLDQRIATIIAEKSTRLSDPGYGALLDVTAQICARRADPQRFMDILSHSAKEGGQLWPRARVRLSDESDAGRAAISIVNAAYVFAWAVPGSLTERVAYLSRGILAIADAWPNALGVAIGCLDGMARQIDVPTASQTLLPALLELRSR